ncbi:unnamed protein product [Prorocentrum cordatum]|uniref:O-fucosyltransferase family protein n=1 Tax=Prorocentrum cordatum TaxID=2364126 RepID=A0ABN9R7N4_9DINO|nr:unnamed protein product [Polarella glacialis]
MASHASAPSLDLELLSQEQPLLQAVHPGPHPRRARRSAAGLAAALLICGAAAALGAHAVRAGAQGCAGGPWGSAPCSADAARGAASLASAAAPAEAAAHEEEVTTTEVETIEASAATGLIRTWRDADVQTTAAFAATPAEQATTTDVEPDEAWGVVTSAAADEDIMEMGATRASTAWPGKRVTTAEGETRGSAVSKWTAPPASIQSTSPRPARYLFFPLHGGSSNQLLATRRALMLGAILNRTVLLPPMLAHYDLNPVLNDTDWTNQTNLMMLSLNRSKEYFKRGSQYRIMTGAYDVGFYNISIMNFATFYSTSICEGRLSLYGGCGRAGAGFLQVVGSGVCPAAASRWRTISDVLGALGTGPLGEAPLLAVGCTYCMHGLDKLDVSKGPPSLQEVLLRVQLTSIPFTGPVLDAARRVSGAVGHYRGLYCAAHLRMPDDMDGHGGNQVRPKNVSGLGTEASVVESYALWLLRELKAARIPEKSVVYVATNLRAGCQHDGFAQLRSRYLCISLGMGDLMCKAGLCDGLPENIDLASLTGMDRGDLMAAIDKQVCVLAEQGFWPTAGDCYTCKKKCPPHQGIATPARRSAHRMSVTRSPVT